MTERPAPEIQQEGVGAFAGRLRDPGSFTVCVALRARDEAGPASAQALRQRIDACAQAGLVHGFFIPDRAAGAGAPPAETIARWVLAGGGEPVVTLSLAGRDRAEALARAKSWRAAGARSLLVVSGDYPAAGARERAVFDIDSMQALLLLRAAAAAGAGFPADLHLGCVVTPFKRLESELMWQYARLRRKIAAGADFVVSQAGYDPRAWDELLRFCRLEQLARPVIGTVLVPDAALARRIGAGAVPGVAIAPRLLGRLTDTAAGAGLRIAAAAVAALRGLGFRGVLLEGRPLAPGEIQFVLEEAERLAPTWRERLDEFYEPLPRFSYFRKDVSTGLNEDRPTAVTGRGWPRPMYGFSYAIDHVLFGPVQPVFRLLTRVCAFCDTRPFWRGALLRLEWLSKAPLYRCRLCGDCTLYACAFFCSESGCPKRMVNGPCGGSRDGRCEVAAAGACLWVKAYDRLKSRVERPTFTAPPLPPKDRRLGGTCSWMNFCLGRDHRRAQAPRDESR